MRIRHHDSSSAEKGKGKRKPKADGRIRSPRAETKPRGHLPNNVTVEPGGCTPNVCGAEGACRPQDNNTTHICYCTYTGLQLTDDCTRNTVPLTPMPIHNVIPPRPTSVNATDEYPPMPTIKSLHPSPGSSLEESRAGGTPEVVSAGAALGSSPALLAAMVSGGLIVLLVVVLLLCYMRRRVCLVAGKSQPRVRPGEPLLAERYITNPQYGLCGGGGGGLQAVQVQGAGETPLQVPLIGRKDLTFLEEVGEGCFGKVHKGLLHTPAEEQVVAIKVLKESAGRSAEEDFVREVSIMSAFKHPNILSLIGVVYRDDINASPWMVFEYMEWGDLAGVLRGSRGGGGVGGGGAGGGGKPALAGAGLRRVALQVARGMQYLAARRFVHRDLAARNCLVGQHLTVKIADFGMSRDIYTSDYYKMGGERPMPVRWMSPESIVYARFTHESDVWSYGVVLWEIYSRGKQPYYGHNNDGATKIILRGILLVPPEDCPPFVCELMRECWRTDPSERITFDEICQKLEMAEESAGAQSTGLPRPPPLLQDAEGYLKPTPITPVDYVDVVPPSYPDTDSDSEEEDEDEEYT